jgi:hypothetical protein
MNLPRNSEELLAQRYRFLEFGVCDVCGKTVEWWMTPKHKQIPINVMYSPKSPAESHWEENCFLKAKLKAKQNDRKESVAA